MSKEVLNRIDPEGEARSSPSQFMKMEALVFAVQTLVLLSSLIWGYSKLVSQVDELERVLQEHTAQEDKYLRKETWLIRNDLIDKKLDAIERKLDMILMQGQQTNSLANQRNR